MINYFRTKKTLNAEIVNLTRRIQNLDYEITQRERDIFFKEKLTLISDYEGQIITASKRAADERELKMMEIVEDKENRIKELELENISLRSGYRNFKDEVREHETIIHDFNIGMQTALSSIKQIAGQFETYEYRMCQVSKRTDKKDTKMVEEGKS